MLMDHYKNTFSTFTMNTEQRRDGNLILIHSTIKKNRQELINMNNKIQEKKIIECIDETSVTVYLPSMRFFVSVRYHFKIEIIFQSSQKKPLHVSWSNIGQYVKHVHIN